MSNEKEEKVIQDEDKLEDFEWDSETTSLELFGEPVKEETGLTEEEKQKLKEEKDEKKEVTKEGDDKKEDKKDDEVIEEKSDEKVEPFSEEGTREEEETIEDKGDVFTVLAEELKEKGVFASVEIPEEELTEDKFIELQEQEIENRIQETFEGFFEELDEDGKAFLKFKKEGGDTKEFFDVVRNTSTHPTGDIEDEDYQRKIAKYYSEKIEGLDGEEADEKVEWLEQNGKLDKHARRYDSKLKDIEEKERKRLDELSKKLAKEKEEAQEQFTNSIKSTLDDNDEIKNFTIAKKEKSELLSYITKPSVKVGKNRFLTGLQSDLNKLAQNPESLVLLAKLIKTDFDTSELSTKIETKNTKNLKEKIQRAKQHVKPKVAGSSGKKSLSEFFGD